MFWLLFVAILLFVGSLPFVDNYAQIGGLVFGMVAACVFLPYITFSCGGNWTLRGRKICLGLGIFFLLVLLLLCKDLFSFSLFYISPAAMNTLNSRLLLDFQAHSDHRPPHPPLISAHPAGYAARKFHARAPSQM